jgi:hypothetical protein
MTRVDTLALGAVVAAWLIGVGVAVGCWWTRRRWAAHRAYTAILERSLDGATQALADLRVEVAEAQRIVADFTQQRLRGAEQADGQAPAYGFVEVSPQNGQRYWSDN